MINVYISNSIYKDIDTKIDKDSSLYKIVTSKGSDVCLDLSYKDFEQRDVTMDEIADDRRVKPRKVVFDLLLGGHEIGDGLSRAIFILSSDVLTDKKAKTIMYKYGVICCTPDNQEMLDSLFEYNVEFSEPTKPFKWSIFLKKISKLPCNSLIITDRFFMREDWWGTIKIDKQTKKPIINEYGYPIYEHQFDNIKEIVNGYCHEFSVKELKILLFYAPDTNKENENDTNFKKYAEKIAGKIKRIFPQLKREIIVIEFYYIKEKGDDKQKDLYRSLHNRRIISNYSVMSTDYSFGSIKGVEQRAQTPTIRGVFSFPSSVIEQDYYIDAICDALDVNNELASDARIACSIDSVGIHWWEGIDEPICNNLICDMIYINDGEKCFYLSVPSQNNWAEIKVLEGVYVAQNYKNCIVSVDKKELENKKEEIRKLFTNPEYTLADDDNFYRIAVSYAPNLKANENGDDKLTSLAIIDPDGSSLENQKQYQNNYFKYKSEAMIVANQIADIIGINRPYSDDEIQKCEQEKEIKQNESEVTNTSETETSESD